MCYSTVSRLFGNSSFYTTLLVILLLKLTSTAANISWEKVTHMKVSSKSKSSLRRVNSNSSIVKVFFVFFFLKVDMLNLK